ncbi:class I SAM-dependent methyltransferase [Brevibacterium sp. BRM-1]|uniref:class I SAM-dependent methyltransferase n=1 Tax=Brevibacterium sp. BRM-1 TaxID=2999062 RepID=UPI00227F3647|nr:class I SAM-dependent methyltransferase [Brevibacterium sp. BRM-1]WAL39996.1 class I SAM-dependent methyltransferase [Brevibacterium sp. BRM-1]
MPALKPIGTITRGTTNPNRLRRVDRYAAFLLEPVLRRDSDRLVVDLGYGATGATPAEMHARLRAVGPRVRTLGLEIDPARVAAAQPWAGEGLSFARGGFELPVPDPPVLVRAYNVLRQYDEAQVPGAWARLTAGLAPDGALIEGTCDEIGRTCVFAVLPAGAARPATLTISVKTDVIAAPSQVADRLPKALIHRNVPGEPVHDWLAQLDRAWASAAGIGSLSPRQRWRAMCAALRAAGEPVLHGPARWRLGEVTVPWERVAPRG